MSVDSLLQLTQRARQDSAVLQALLSDPESVIPDFETSAHAAAIARIHGAREPQDPSASGGVLYSCNKTSCGCGGSI